MYPNTPLQKMCIRDRLEELCPLVKDAGCGVVVCEMCIRDRGDANVIPGLCRWAEKRMAERSPFVVISGELDAPGDELTEQLEKKFHYGCSGRYKAGASIAINAGPKVVGVLVKGAKKR